VGLVSGVVSEDKLLETGLAFAAEMARASPMGLRLTKQTLNALIDAPGIDAALMIEDRQQVILLETAITAKPSRRFANARPVLFRSIATDKPELETVRVSQRANSGVRYLLSPNDAANSLS